MDETLIDIHNPCELADPMFLENETLFRNVFEQSAGGMALVSCDGRLLRVNHALWAMLGYTEAELLTLTLPELLHPDDHHQYRTSTQTLLADAVPVDHAEWRYLHKQGYYVWTLVSMALVQDVIAQPTCFVLHIQDLCAHKQREAAHAARAQSLQLLFEHSSQCIILLDPTGIVLEMNQAALDCAGLTRAEVVQFPFWEMRWWSITPQTQQQIQAAIAEAQQGHSIAYEIDVLAAENQVATLELLLKPVTDMTGQVIMLIAEGRDITEPKRARAAREQMEDRIRDAFDYATIGMALLTPDGRWLKVNQALCDMVGYTEAELLTMNFQSITHPDDLEKNLHHASQLLGGAIRNYEMEKRYIHKRGHIVWVSLSVSLVRDAQGTPLYTVAQTQDITQRKRTERELERQTSELTRSNAELEQFAYVASHDLQEPLRKVASYTTLLARRYKGQLDPGADKYIDYIVDGATRMQNLISDLLTYSRVGREQLVMEPVQLSEIVEQVLSDIGATVRESQAVITYDALPTIAVNRQQIGQVLQNLIANALKFHGHAPPCIHITAELRSDTWVIGVRDNGIGIEPQYAERIFAVFQRLHSRTEYPGTGIGLAICKKIVERHGGTIWMDSEPGQGSTFYFSLPLP